MSFARLSAERRREISSLGGKARAAKGTGHRFTKEEAAIAGSKGGKVVQERKREAKALTEATAE